MEEQLIGYLLNALDERGMRDVEAYLHAHPEARRKVAQLRQAIEPLAADLEAPAPPPQLAERALALVAEHICAGNAPPSRDLPMAPPLSPQTASGGRSWWRRSDIMVAACLLITSVGIALVVLGRMRGPTSSAMVVECKNNLRQFFVSLQEYRDVNGNFPDVAKESPRDVAGMVVPILSEAGTLSDGVSIRCPGVGPYLSCSFTADDLRKMSDPEFELHSSSLSMCYAYSLGYRDADGSIRGPGESALVAGFSQIPIMADRPPAVGVPCNSINHGGAGQNVLFADGHVTFILRRTLGADNDIFLNRDNMVAAGLDAADFVLGYSAARAQP